MDHSIIHCVIHVLKKKVKDFFVSISLRDFLYLLVSVGFCVQYFVCSYSVLGIKTLTVVPSSRAQREAK
jgi:hypothetical protein